MLLNIKDFSEAILNHFCLSILPQNVHKMYRAGKKEQHNSDDAF